MSKPTAADYRSALQNPQFAFKGTELETAVAAKDHLGLPKMATGNFAAVCEMRSGSKRWAVRCFLRDVPQIESRSKTVADFVGGYLDQIPSLVSTKFVANGINVLNKHYPIVVMDWVEGIPLDSWIDSQIKKGQPLHQVLNGWLQMIADLERIGAAHGDLQHGNVLVAGDRLRLVDYDGMFVPVTNCPKPNEIGHPNYQAPSRTITRFDSYVDRFSSLLVSTAIYSLTLHPALWHECSMPDDAILFRRSDLEHPKDLHFLAA